MIDYITDTSKGVIEKKRRYKPLFHFSPRKGWINDPNGLVKIDDGYRLFAQHNPYQPVWGPMHWLDIRSNDLIKFEESDRYALKPDKDYDQKFGCFSGSSIIKDGKLWLMYTGASEEKQVQCLAVEEGDGFKKIDSNPVLDENELPSTYMIKDFRDPKVIWVNGMYYCFLATRKVAGHSSIVLFKSEDLISWKFVKSVLESEDFNSEMFECPDIVRVGDKDLLMFSIQGFGGIEGRLVNKNNVLGCIGKMNFEKGVFTPLSKWRPVDDGFDFYATQTSYSKDDNPLLISWMNAWGSKDYTGENEGWCGRFTLPRFLSVDKNNRFIQTFSTELDKYECEFIKSKKIDEINEYSKDNPREFLDINLELDKKNLEDLLIGLNCGEEKVELSVENDMLKVDRSNCFNKITTETKIDDFVRYAELDKSKATLKLRIVIDVTSIEIQIDDGYSMMSLNFYPKIPDYSLSIENNDSDSLLECDIKTNK